MAVSLIVISCVVANLFCNGDSRRTQSPIVLQSHTLVDAGSEVSSEASSAVLNSHVSSHTRNAVSRSSFMGDDAEAPKHLASVLLASNPALALRPSSVEDVRSSSASVSSHGRSPHAHHRLASNAIPASGNLEQPAGIAAVDGLATNAVRRQRRGSARHDAKTIGMSAADDLDEEQAKPAEEDAVTQPASRTTLQKARDITKVLAVGSACLAFGFLALFYVTNFFEQLMHNTPGFVGNGRQGPLVAGGTGFLSGVLHTLAGPDHFVGLMPMVVGQPISTARAVFLGALWGSGHAVGQLFLGLGFLFLQMGFLRYAQTSFLADNIAKASGALVGLALVSIGLLGLKDAREFDENEIGQETERFGRRSFLTGIFHGLAPDSIVFLAPALALPRLAAILHVSGVFVGTLTAMAFCTAALKILCRKSPRLKYISGGASVAAIMLGSCIMAAAFGYSINVPFLQS